jgi:Ca-activated chloride channel homolog
VATTEKARAETPLYTDKGDPLLAHWQYGLGRAVAFTSDAQARWAAAWLSWEKYRQFWLQIANWSLRKLETADLATDVSLEDGQGVLSVEALDAEGNFRNFLNLQTIVVSPQGERQTVRLQQTGPGHYEARFPTLEEGAYLLNLAEIEDGQPRASLVVGASVNYSPEFAAGEPHHHLLRRIAETTGGRVLRVDDPADNPFLRDRQKTFQPRDLFEWLLILAILLFPVDVGVRRIDIDRTEWAKAMRWLRRWILFWQGPPRPVEADESLAVLLARRDQVRAQQPMAQAGAPAADLFRPVQPVDVQSAQAFAPASEPTPIGVAPAATADDSASGKPTAASTASRLLEAKRRAQHRRR